MHVLPGFSAISTTALGPVMLRAPAELLEMSLLLAREALLSISWTFLWWMSSPTVPALGLTPTVAMLLPTSALFVAWAFEALLGYCINLSQLWFVNVLEKTLAQFLGLNGTLYSLRYCKTLGWGISSFHPV